MRRTVLLALAVVVALAAVPTLALAQAPAPTPKVTITGLIDNVGTYSRNLSFTDTTIGGLTRTGDDETFGRTRGRWDIIGELGRAKAVLGLEIDLTYGATNAADNVIQAAPQKLAQTGAFDADNDVIAAIEIKWMYVDFPLTGPGSLLPFIPFTGNMIVGGQPYALGLKPSILADTDFGGVSMNVAFSPNVRLRLVYAQLEEAATGPITFGSANIGQAGPPAGTTRFSRGDDWGIIAKLDVEPMKGLRVSPFYAFQEIQGTTAAIVRRATGGYFAGAAISGAGFPGGFVPDQAAPCWRDNVGTMTDQRCRTTEEQRHFLGLDARWQAGPVYVAPTFIYQIGHRERYIGIFDPGANIAEQKRKTAAIYAWIADVEAGAQIGPLLLQARAMYSSGNKTEDNLNEEIRYYQPFQTGNSYWSGYGCVHTGCVDYLSPIYGFSNQYAVVSQPSYDRYGRAMFAVSARYSITPAFSAWVMVNPMWTARKVDTDGLVTANGLVSTSEGAAAALATAAPHSRRDKGDDRYLGTDLSAGFTWRFAPGLTFDAMQGVFVAGDAYDNVACRTFTSASACASPGHVKKHEAENVYTTQVRVRYAF